MSHRPRKRFGQNFLHDQGVIEHILNRVNPLPGERLVEIGPGQGALTSGLLGRVGALDAIELDRDLIEPLKDRSAGLGELRLHNADALAYDFRQLRGAGPRLRLVGNLPYNISTPLLFHLLGQADAVEDMHFMLQKEVVARMAAGPGSKTYGRLSVMLQVSCEVSALFDIGPESFDPRPKVDSSLVRLVPLTTPLVAPAEMAGFSTLVAAAFAHRRKTLRNNLKAWLDDAQINALGIDPAARAESLAIPEFKRLHDARPQRTVARRP